MPYKVVRDTREKLGHGWNFPKSKLCLGQISCKLDSGDYSLMGLEDVVSIERKGSISEFATNTTEQRFVDELDRLQEIRHSFVILEFTMEQLIKYPVGSGIPAYKWKYMKVKGPQVLKFMLEFQLRYNTQFMLCGSYGKAVASSIFKRVVEEVDGK